MLTPGTQRFEQFTKTNNIGFAAIEDIKNSDVYNAISNKLHEVTDELKSMVNGLVQSTGLPVDEIKDMVNKYQRTVKDTFTTLQSLTKFTPAALEKEIASFIPGGPAMQNAFRNLAAECRDKASSNVPGFKPIKDKMSCGNPSDGKCQSSEVSGFLNKLTGGAIGSIGRAMQNALKALMTLANLGYSGGLCKIFGALMNGLPADIIQRGAAGVLATVAGVGNITGVLDVASAIGGMVGINPSSEINGLVGRITDNFAIPGNYKEGSLAGLYDGMTSAFDTIHPGYDKSVDGLTSIANLGVPGSNSSFAKTSSEWLGSSFSTASFDQPYAPSGFESAVSYVGSVGSNISNTLSSWFG